MDKIKNFLLHKLTLRVGYIIAAFSSAKIISVVGAPVVQNFLTNVLPILALKAGLKVSISIAIIDPDLLKTAIAGGVMIAGEFIYRLLHTKFVLPRVSIPTEITPPPVVPKS